MEGEDKALEEAKKKALKERLLRLVFTSEARERLANVRMVRPEIAEAVENHVIQLYTSGKLNRALTDEELKQLLLALQKDKREFRIRWA
ncbi:MAG: DNA-binding protein [Nitrososphaerales archaeon]